MVNGCVVPHRSRSLEPDPFRNVYRVCRDYRDTATNSRLLILASHRCLSNGNINMVDVFSVHADVIATTQVHVLVAFVIILASLSQDDRHDSTGLLCRRAAEGAG
jgi:hypothetical protein